MGKPPPALGSFNRRAVSGSETGESEGGNSTEMRPRNRLLRSHGLALQPTNFDAEPGTHVEGPEGEMFRLPAPFPVFALEKCQHLAFPS